MVTPFFIFICNSPRCSLWKNEDFTRENIFCKGFVCLFEKWYVSFTFLFLFDCLCDLFKIVFMFFVYLCIFYVIYFITFMDWIWTYAPAPITQLLFIHTLYFRLAWGINGALLWFYPRLALMKPQISWKVYKVVDNSWCAFLRSIVFMPYKPRVNLFNIKLSKGLLFLVYKYPIFYT